MIPTLTGNPATHLYSLQELAAIIQIAMKGAWDADINDTEHMPSEDTWQYHHSLVSIVTMQNSEMDQLLVVTFKDDYDYTYMVTLNLTEGNYQTDSMKTPEDFPTEFLLVNQLNERDGMAGGEPEDDTVVCPTCQGRDLDCTTCEGEGEIAILQMKSLPGASVYCGLNNMKTTLQTGSKGVVQCGECMQGVTSAEFTDNHF